MFIQFYCQAPVCSDYKDLYLSFLSLMPKKMLELFLQKQYLFLPQRDTGFSLSTLNLLAAALLVQSSPASNNTVHNTKEVPQLHTY